MPWRYVDGYAVGTSHVDSNVPCQDRTASVVLRSDDGAEVFLAVVSDGAGSAARAERAAEIVCETLAALAGEDLRASSDLDRIGDERVRSWFLETREALRAAARESDDGMRDYAATALLAIVSDHQALCAGIGDGGIVVRRAAGDPFEVAFWPASGEYANETYFVTDDTAPERVAMRRFDDVMDLVAFSDGLQNLALERATQTAFQPFFEPLARTVRESAESNGALRDSLVAYLGSDAVNERTDDDKSLVIGCRVAEG